MIAAAMKASFAALGAELRPLLGRAAELSAEAFLGEAAALVERFSRREGYDLRRVAIHGWSQALIDPKLAGIQRAFYGEIASELRPLARRWPGFTAERLLAILLGNTVDAALLDQRH
jgi:hypothetical protein